MTYQVLARRWRPRDFRQVVGQAHVVRALCNALDADRVHHAFLFSGTRGVGKTTLARILAKCLNCEAGVSSTPCGSCGACCEVDEGRFVDLIEVDAASRAKVDETRELMDNVQFSPTRGRYKVYLIDEVHMFSTHSFNALLKTLEEPPPHVKFLLATTDPQKLPVTVLSRCLQFNLKRLPVEQIASHLELIVGQEGVAYDLPALKHLARAADGSMRDALSLLDQAIAHGGGALTADDVRAMLGTLSSDRVGELLSALAERDGSRLMRCIAEMAEQVVDFAAALQALVTQLQRLAVFQLVPDAIRAEDDDVALLERLAARLDPAEVQLYYQIGLMAGRDLPLAPAPQLGFEMAMLRMLAFAPDARMEDRLGPAERPADAGTRLRSEPSPEHRPRLEAEGWAHAVAAMSLTGLVRELAANVHPVRMEGGRIELRLSPGHAHLDTRNLREQLEAALTDYCGERIRVTVSFGEPAMETPADQRRKVDERRQQAAIESMESDPNVQAIVDAFDAVLDKSSIRPVDNEA